MFRKIIPCFFLTVFSVSPPASAQTAACDIRIEFGSFRTSIDSATYQKVMDRVLAAPEVGEKHIDNIGPNGERTLCLLLADPARIAPLYEELKALIPEQSREGWERITSAQGHEFMTRLAPKPW